MTSRNHETYRAFRRNLARAKKIRFPWDVAKVKFHFVRDKLVPNKKGQFNYQDFAKVALRKSKEVTMNFLSPAGLSLMLINHKLITVSKKKPKRGWAAERRRASPHNTYFPPEEMEKIRQRHIHPRHKRIAA